MKIQSPNSAFTVDEFLELNDGTFQYEDRDTGRFYLEQIKWPQLVTEKFDGIRAFKENGKVYTRSGKQVPNHNTRRALEAFPLDNFDCELTIQYATFDEVQSAIMTREGYPEIQVKIFDRIMVGRAEDRVKSLDDNFERANDRLAVMNNFPEVTFDVVMPTICRNLQQLQKLVAKYAKSGEGACFKWAQAQYKRGRGTLKDQTLLKFKPFVDDEARVVGFEELMINTNDQEINELGKTKRSKKKAGMVLGDTLGALVVTWKGKTFMIGSGLNAIKRKIIWDNQKKFCGEYIVFKYQKYGMKADGKPRTPIYKGFRDMKDL